MTIGPFHLNSFLGFCEFIAFSFISSFVLMIPLSFIALVYEYCRSLISIRRVKIKALEEDIQRLEDELQYLKGKRDIESLMRGLEDMKNKCFDQPQE